MSDDERTNDELKKLLRKGSAMPPPDAVANRSPSVFSEPRPIAIDFEFPNGNHAALPYSSLLYMAFNPSVGISAIFATHSVRIRGVCLQPVHDGLVRQSIAVLKAVGDRLKECPKDVPVVTSIEVEDRTGQFGGQPLP